jgi:predicted component of type VI protein secretion system
MAVTLKIFTKAGGRASLYATREFDSLPVTIGRDASCSVALADPQKHISRFHAELEEQDGTYWMSVVSKVNAVMVKGRRYGPGTRLTLHSGDTFDIGEYEVHVLLPEKVSPAAPAKPMDIFEEPTFVAEKAPAVSELKASATLEQKPTAVAPAQASHLLRAFFDGAGLAQKELSSAQAERMLRDCGAILRAAVEGLMMLLIARGEMRRELHAEDRTMVAARDNNPLKLMSDPHEAMAFLFDPADRTDGFLDPVQAIGDACEDLRSHELALMAGMRAAIGGALRRLDPHALERAYENSTPRLSFGSRKAKLWEFFLAQHEKLSREAQEDFDKLFGRDFMRAYQAQLQRLKGSQ